MRVVYLQQSTLRVSFPFGGKTSIQEKIPYLTLFPVIYGNEYSAMLLRLADERNNKL